MTTPNVGQETPSLLSSSSDMLKLQTVSKKPGEEASTLASESSPKVSGKKKEALKIAKKASTYTYQIGMGPFCVKCNGSYEKDLQNLDNIFCYLDEPDLDSSESIGSQLGSFQSKLAKRFARLWNFVFGDHRWYNEVCARKLIKHFASGMDESAKNEAMRQKILHVYDRLATIKHGDSTYTQGIERQSLENHSWMRIDKIIGLYDSLPEMPALKSFAKTIGIVALIAAKIWLNAKIAQKFGEAKAPLLDSKWTVLTGQFADALISDLKFG